MPRRAAHAEIDTACHVFPGFPAFPRSVPRKYCVHLSDPVWFGPCDLDPVIHAAKRRAFLEESWTRNRLEDESPRRLQRKKRELQEWLASTLFASRKLADEIRRRPESLPVILWTSPCWEDQVPLWWVLDAIEREGLGRERFFVAEPDPPSDIPEWHLSSCPTEWLANGFSRRTPVTASLCREGASLWRKYASPSPLALDRSREATTRSFPHLRKSLESFGLFFPRVYGDSSKLRLSQWDEILLEGFSTTSWQRPIDAFKAKRSRWLQLMMSFGDLSLLDRLRNWGSWCPKRPLLLVRPRRGGVSPFTRREYRLTPRGWEVLKEGIIAIDDAPAMQMGGTRLYDPQHAWFRRILKDHWRIEQL
jgi:hypothetical protein